MTDKEIIKLYFERNEQALTETENSYGGYCYAIGLSVLNSKEDCEECVNETLLRAWNSIPPNKPNKLSAFLGKITRNIAFDKYRSDRAIKRGKGEMTVILDELQECIPSAFDTDSHIDNIELKEKLNDFLHTLSHKDCAVFLQRYWYAKPVAAIAEKYGMNQNTVKASLFRTRKKLEAYLSKSGICI